MLYTPRSAPASSSSHTVRLQLLTHTQYTSLLWLSVTAYPRFSSLFVSSWDQIRPKRTEQGIRQNKHQQPTQYLCTCVRNALCIYKRSHTAEPAEAKIFICVASASLFIYSNFSKREWRFFVYIFLYSIGDCVLRLLRPACVCAAWALLLYIQHPEINRI